jgi:hypothetical protein
MGWAFADGGPTHRIRGVLAGLLRPLSLAELPLTRRSPVSGWGAVCQKWRVADAGDWKLAFIGRAGGLPLCSESCHTSANQASDVCQLPRIANSRFRPVADVQPTGSERPVRSVRSRSGVAGVAAVSAIKLTLAPRPAVARALAVRASADPSGATLRSAPHERPPPRSATEFQSTLSCHSRFFETVRQTCLGSTRFVPDKRPFTASGGRPVPAVQCTEMGDRTVPIAGVDLEPTEVSKAGGALHNQELTPFVRDASFHRG